jgi:tetratricopeptide (TPR) repeat protein
MNDLMKYSLISKATSPETGEVKVTMLPLTELFGRRKAAKDYKDLRMETNRKYLKFLEITSDDKISANRAMSINKAEEAMRLYRSGKDNEAEKAFQESISYDNKNDYAFYLYSIFSKERQNHGQAISLIERAIDVEPNNPVYWMEYSNIYDIWNDLKKSERVLEEGLRRCNHDLRITQKLVVIKERLNKLEEAISIAEKHIDMNPSDSKRSFLNTLFVIAILEGNWRLGYKYRRTNRDSALAYFLDGINSDEKYRKVIQTNNAKLLYHEKKMLKAIGEIYQSKGKIDEAISFYSRCKYDIAFFPDRRRHNHEMDKRISYLETIRTK